MPGPGLSYGLNITKKTPNRPQPAKRKPIFGEPDDDSEQEDGNVEEIGEFGGLSKSPKPAEHSRPGIKPSKNGKKAPSMYGGDLSSSFTSSKHSKTAEELDPTIMDYDAFHDTVKSAKQKAVPEDVERKPKYLTGLLASAAVRKRDATIAEEKKLARDRELEGDEFADKEKFVTSAYKKQQEENRRIEEEERRKEEAEAKRNKGAGASIFNKNLLDQREQQHAEVMKAVEEAAKRGSTEKVEETREKSEAELAREFHEKTGANIAVNDEGQIVDRTQLLKGGLNVKAKPKTTGPSKASSSGFSMADRSKGPGMVGAGGSKRERIERQSRMMEAQLMEATKRALEEDEGEKEKIERASKSRKTEGDIMSAKERYLARKKEAEEAKKRGEVP